MKIVEYGKENSETILLLHGGGLSWWNYRKQAELLGGRFHVVIPILDGHAGSDTDFISIEENAKRILSFIRQQFGGSVLLIGGLSLGAQILAEILSAQTNICRYAIMESASVIPSEITNALIGPAFSISYGLMHKKWFAKMQFRYLGIRDDLFDDYYRDTREISKQNMISFLKANTNYKPKQSLRNNRARICIVAGSKEQKQVQKSAKLLHEMCPDSSLEWKEDMYHGEYSLNHPELYVDELLKMLAL